MTSLVDMVMHASPMASVAIAGAGASLFMSLRRIPGVVGDWIKRHTVLDLVVHSDDDAYRWLEQWLARQSFAHKSRSLTLRAQQIRSGSMDELEPTQYFLTFGDGSHFFRWRRRIFMVTLITESLQPGMKALRTLKVRVLGRSQKALRDLIADVHKAVVQPHLTTIRVWRNSYWQRLSEGRRPRELSTVVLPQTQLDALLEDFSTFLKSASVYADRGIPYRRGYLFSGPPGTGKTSLVLALASHFNKDVCVINLGSLANDDRLEDALLTAAPSSFVLIEDIDCATAVLTRQESDNTESVQSIASSKIESSISLSGVLNALDGVTTPEGLITIMTTNYPDTLDAALIRPGRVDRHEVFDKLGPAEQKRMASKFFTGVEFKALPYPIAAAELQGACLKHPNDAKAAWQEAAKASRESHNKIVDLAA